MIKRWSFHPPHDPEKVVINEEENKYFSFRFSTAKFFELDDKHLSEKRNSEPPNRESLPIPDLVLNLEETEKDSEVDPMDDNDDEEPVSRRKVFYRKPSKYVRPKLSLVEEEDDEDVYNASHRHSFRESMVINASTRSSVRDSMVIHEDSDSEEDYIETTHVL